MLIYPEESYAIRGACMDVYRVLGSGFLEAVYQDVWKLNSNAVEFHMSLRSF